MAGQKPSSLDREALEDILAAGGVSLLSPLLRPNCFSWYSIASKFSPEVTKNWPKMKAPAATSASAAAATAAPAGGNQRGQKKAAGGKKEDPKKKAA